MQWILFGMRTVSPYTLIPDPLNKSYLFRIDDFVLTETMKYIITFFDDVIEIQIVINAVAYPKRISFAQFT